MHLDARPVRCFAHPHVEVLPFPRLEKENVVAVVQIRDLVQVVKLRLRIQLCVFTTVGKHSYYVFEEMAMSVLLCQLSNLYSKKQTEAEIVHEPVRYSAGCQDQNSLLVLFCTIVILGILGAGLRYRFVDGCHREVGGEYEAEKLRCGRTNFFAVTIKWPGNPSIYSGRTQVSHHLVPSPREETSPHMWRYYL